jgi:hypothetical protein
MSTVREQTCLIFPLAGYMDGTLNVQVAHVQFLNTLLWQNMSPYYADSHQAVFEL